MNIVQITDANQLMTLEENKFIGELPNLTKSQINFIGKNNILICEEGVHLRDSRINFNIDNSILYLSGSIHDYSINISLHENNVCFIGKNNFFDGRATFVLSEAKNIILGDNCFISYNVIFRTSDDYCMYKIGSKNCLNHAKSIYVGDHVFFDQNSMILKGSVIGSGAIIGAGTVVSNKSIRSNTMSAGIPLRTINENTFWTSNLNHGNGEYGIQEISKSNHDLFVYDVNEDTLDLDTVEANLNDFSDLEDVVDYLVFTFLLAGKNRFASNRDIYMF